jgi:hypothetical protein
MFGPLGQQLPQVPVDGKQLSREIHTFFQASVNGAYYVPFLISSTNFSDIPEEMDAWFEQLGDFLARSRPSLSRDSFKTPVGVLVCSTP